MRTLRTYSVNNFSKYHVSLLTIVIILYIHLEYLILQLEVCTSFFLFWYHYSKII